jgi:hypothetical protein
MLLSGCSRSDQLDVLLSDAADSSGAAASQESLSPDTVATIKSFCGDCHPFPLPETFPKDHWEEEVVQGFDFYISSGRTDLVEPSRQETIRYYLEQAPDVVEVTRADARPSQSASVAFELWPCQMPSIDASTSVSHLIDAGPAGLFTADMRRGGIHHWTVTPEGDWRSREIGRGRNSCRLTRCDWNQDGREDLLVGEIGSYGVGDHSRGRVSVLVQDAAGGFEHQLLAEGLARVVEAAPMDYEGDGDLDLLVAEFGWLETGALKLLRNVGSEGDSAGVDDRFEIEVIDSRHGALGVRVLDMNGDQQLDFVVAFGQEHESLEIWYGEGDGAYRHEVVMELPDPSYNSSSFEVVDVDQDGRLDIVHTNGDTLDAFLPKPYHGVRWLRHLEDGSWERRELGLLIGALQAVVADLDRDGDLDIAAVGMYPQAGEDPGAYDSVCWWEQREDLQFVQHTIERDRCDYASLVSRDIDGDGYLDLVLANWSVGPHEDRLRIYRCIPSSRQ